MPLTDNEEMLCLAFLGYPTDFYPLHSKVVLKLKDPILLSLPGIDLGSVLLGKMGSICGGWGVQVSQ